MAVLERARLGLPELLREPAGAAGTTPVGFDTADYLLDIVVQPDLTWSWKDEDEFDEALEHELIPPVLLHAVRSEGRRFIREIEGRQWPFGKRLERWRPEPEWDVPSLPESWVQGLTWLD